MIADELRSNELGGRHPGAAPVLGRSFEPHQQSWHDRRFHRQRCSGNFLNYLWLRNGQP